jgi:hypothetical protein
VPREAADADFLLLYVSAPENWIADVFKLAGPVEYVKRGKDWAAPIRRVCRLGAPVHFRELKDNPILRNAGFVRSNMRRRGSVSEYWSELYRMIVARNPSAKPKLLKFGPERLW